MREFNKQQLRDIFEIKKKIDESWKKFHYFKGKKKEISERAGWFLVSFFWMPGLVLGALAWLPVIFGVAAMIAWILWGVLLLLFWRGPYRGERRAFEEVWELEKPLFRDYSLNYQRVWETVPTAETSRPYIAVGEAASRLIDRDEGLELRDDGTWHQPREDLAHTE